MNEQEMFSVFAKNNVQRIMVYPSCVEPWI